MHSLYDKSNGRLPLQIKIALQTKHGQNWKKKLIGRKIKIPFIPKKYGIEYEKVLVAYFQNYFLTIIDEVGKQIIAELKSRQDSAIEDRFLQSFDRAEIEAKFASKTLIISIAYMARKVYSYHKDIFQKSTKQAFGIDIQLTDENVLSSLDGWIETNLNLIKDLRQEMLPKIKEYMKEAFKNGVRPEEIAGFLKHTADYTKYRAGLIANDQIGKLYGQMNKQRQTDLGIEYYIWKTCGDDRVRPKHRALDGTKRRWDDGIIPNEEIRCRCSGEGVLDKGLFD